MPRYRIGVSACLVGEPTRYDGEEATDPIIVGWLVDRAETFPLCPEVGAGMAVPRPPIHLVDGGLYAVERERPDHDVTPDLRRWFDTTLPTLGALHGVVLKSRSPSCGVSDTPVAEGGVTAGLFARWLQESYPDLPVIDENGFADPVGRELWWRQVIDFA